MVCVASVEVAVAADVGVEQGLAVRGRRRAWSVEAVAEDRGDGIVGQHPDLDSAQADRLGPLSGGAANRRKMPMQVRKPCSGCGRRDRTARINASVCGPKSRA